MRKNRRLRDKIAEIAYELSENQILAAKMGAVTDFKVEETIDAILQAFLDALPEEKTLRHYDGILKYPEDAGFNLCLTKIKSKLK